MLAKSSSRLLKAYYFPGMKVCIYSTSAISWEEKELVQWEKKRGEEE